ncbi:hypothetical protein LIER_21187 [Lithospermum erythrorhizon]|uniref:Uncharacterized protein n=1 Tax=Lithospermum erythrorhizon TaxID=34254 RepID=A0AAV3QPF3_LITER
MTRDDMKGYKDLKITDIPIMEEQISRELQENVQIKLQLDPSEGRGNKSESEGLKSLIDEQSQDTDDAEVQSKSRSPWRIDIHEVLEEVQISQPEEELIEGQLRKSIRERRLHSKYEDDVYVRVKESTIFEEASKNYEWARSVRKEF